MVDRTLHPSLLPSPNVGYSLHVPEVDETDGIVVANEYVSRMRVGVERPVDEELLSMHFKDEGNYPICVQRKC